MMPLRSRLQEVVNRLEYSTDTTRLRDHSGPANCITLRISLCCLLTITAAACQSVGIAEEARSTALPVLTSTSEELFRKEAIETTRPTCSETQTRQSPAVGVAQLSVAMSGRVLDVEVLEAPNDADANAMRNALRQWRFRALEKIRGQPQIFSGNVTMYFLGTAASCRVAYADEVGYVGK